MYFFIAAYKISRYKTFAKNRHYLGKNFSTLSFSIGRDRPCYIYTTDRAENPTFCEINGGNHQHKTCITFFFIESLNTFLRKQKLL